MSFKSGFVSLIGRPNVGKSTLMNLFIGEKASIVSAKPQTTRNTIRGVLTGDDYQIIFLDTPGVHEPKTKLGGFMVRSALAAMNESDLVLYMVEPRRTMHDGDKILTERLRKVSAPVFLLINKTDEAVKSDLLKIIDDYRTRADFKEIFPISALKADNTGALLDAVRETLPEGPMYYSEDTLTDQPERMIAAELVREKALFYLQEEIPHGTAVEIQQMRGRENSEIIDVDACVYCEKDSHKAIVIGKGGEMLKKIGTAARRDIESLLGVKINLRLWVKVKKNWRDNERLLRSLGYDLKIDGPR